MPDLTAEEKAAREAAVRAELNAEAEHVMNTSKPTPSQADLDAIRSGKARLDDKEDDENPSMPPLVEQRARLAGDGAYRTRETRAGRFSDESYPQHRGLTKELEKTPAAPAPAEPVKDAIATTASSGALTSGPKKP